MSRTDSVLERADVLLAGIRGDMLLARARQGGLTRAIIKSWVRRLREAADTIERDLLS